MKKEQSIQGKLMRLVLAISGIVLFLTGAGFFAFETITFRQANKEKLLTIGKVIAANSTAVLAFGDPDDATELLQALKAEKHIVAACLYDNRGNIIAKYPLTIPGYKLPLHPGVEQLAYKMSHLEGFIPVIQREAQVGTLYLQSDMKDLDQRFVQYAMITLLVIAISIVVAHLLTQSLQTKISAPILALAKSAGNVSQQRDYTVRAQKFDDDELGVLTDAFNQMLTQIEKQNAEIISLNHELELKVVERTNELEKANVELKLKSDFEETIINSSIDMIAVFDKEYRYVILNKYGQEAFGVEAKDVIGKKLLEVFPQVKSSVMYQTLQKAFQKGEIIHTPNYKSHISDRVMENYFIPLFDKEKKVYQVLVVGHDITEINKAHEKLKQVNKELEKSNLDLEQFAFVASHDLQEPLRKIRTFSQLLEQKLDDKVAAQKYLEKIISSAGRMTDLIKAVLNYSRLTNAKEQFQKVDLDEVIENIKSDYELTIAEKEAKIIHDKLPLIWGNSFQLNQLFLNLVSNSLKFSKQQPTIIISCRIIDNSETVDQQEITGEDKFVELTFSDNGIGFDDTYADKVFTVFQRLHSKLEYPGTGIGLALCKKIVDNHNGNISVISSPGKGTTFTIILPINLPETKPVFVS
jgi:PAS domain S-box-containing protein